MIEDVRRVSLVKSRNIIKFLKLIDLTFSLLHLREQYRTAQSLHGSSMISG